MFAIREMSTVCGDDVRVRACVHAIYVQRKMRTRRTSSNVKCVREACLMNHRLIAYLRIRKVEHWSENSFMSDVGAAGSTEA